MIVYIIDKSRLISFTLPQKVYGSYWISDIDDENQEKKIINIQEEEGHWVAYSNKSVSILNNNQPTNKLILESYSFSLLKLKNQEGYLILYVSPLNDETKKNFMLSNNYSLSIGSANDNIICYRNQLTSQHHAKLEFKNNTWIIEDLNSQNGTFINNKAIVPAQPTMLNHGDIIFIMGLKIIVLGNQLTINNPLNSVIVNPNMLKEKTEEKKTENIPTDEDELETELYEDNDYFVRLPRFTEILETRNFKIDPHPNVTEQDETPLIMTIGPMFTMGSVSFVMLIVAFMSFQSGTRSFYSILPTIAISISMLTGVLLWPTLNRRFTRKQQKKRKEKIEKAYSEYLTKKEQELQQIITTEKQVLLANSLSPNECYDFIINKNRRLWERELHQKDFLNLRLGIGKEKVKINIDYPGEHFKVDQDPLEERMHLIIEKNKEIDGAPITESFIEKNITAIIGHYEHIKTYVDTLILQMIALHSYHDLKIVIMTNEGRAKYWEYMKLMPHNFNRDKSLRFFSTNFDESKEVSSYLQKILKSRQETKINSNEDVYKLFDTYYIIITDDYKTVKDNLIIEEILNAEQNLGFSLLILNSSLANLPTQCKSFISINDLKNGGVFENELNKETQRTFQIELVNQMNLFKCANILANIPIKDKDDEYSLPKQIGFLEMYNVGTIEQLNPLERWQANNPIISLAAPIGYGTNGQIFKLDLHEKEQGPHGLIAGMTGSGKSEFIITYILSMAINYHPDEVQFLLIDYKGGGLVGAFENKETGLKLPHLTGTITNLDTADINRALSSIESELKRRQALFNKARDKLGEGTIDIYKYQKYYREKQLDTPISHLFIISDEFAELKTDQPEFMDQLISTARIGRSLGVHLILATQKPSGVVNDQIWSNSRFKVCLKVQDAQDSNEVIKRPDAATIKETGRFYLQVGYNELFQMGQAAYAGAPYYPQDKVYKEIDSSVNFIDNIARSIKSIDVPRSNKLELKGEQLPNIVKYLSSLAEKENIKVHPLWLDKLKSIIYIDDLKKKYQFNKIAYNITPIIGEYDNPKEQKQGLVTLDFVNRGNAIIYSTTEKNTITNTILYSLITTYTSEEINIYVLDFDSETLKIYQESPSVGDVVFVNEKEKVTKLFKLLVEELNQRKKIFQDYNGNYDYYIKHSDAKLPAIILLLAGYENFKETYEEEEQTLNKITRDGVKYGLYTIVSAISDRSLRLSIRTNFPQIIPLKLNSNVEYNMLLGKKAPTISDTANRGVVLINENPYEFQTAQVCESEKLLEYVKSICNYLKSHTQVYARPIPVLPDKVTISMLSDYLKDITNVPIGLEEETLNIATYDFTKNLISLINAEDNETLSKFSKLLIKELTMINNLKITILDFRNLYKESDFTDCNYVDASSFDFTNFNNLIESIDLNSKLLIFITDAEQFISNISKGITDITSYFAKVLSLKRVYFVFNTDLFNLKKIGYESWFRQFVTINNAIWIGKGLNNTTVHNLTTPLRSLSFPLPPNFGYNIKNGKAIRIKVLEGDKDE